jgi:hypothetical protein
MEREFDRERPQVKPTGPTPEELGREREAKLQAEKHTAEVETARAQAKAEAMERFVRDSYAAGRQNTAPPEDSRKAVNELGLTEEQILADPTGSIAKISDHIRRQNEEMFQYREQVNSVVGNLARSNFKAEMENVSKDRFGSYLMGHVEDYFRRNPNAALNEGEVRRVYNELVGQNYVELERLEKEKVGVSPPQDRERVVENTFRAASYAPAPEKKLSKLPEDEAFMLGEMNKRMPAHYQMDETEWEEIRSGRKFPKKISTDIQVRGARPNVSYD